MSDDLKEKVLDCFISGSTERSLSDLEEMTQPPSLAFLQHTMISMLDSKELSATFKAFDQTYWDLEKVPPKVEIFDPDVGLKEVQVLTSHVSVVFRKSPPRSEIETEFEGLSSELQSKVLKKAGFDSFEEAYTKMPPSYLYDLVYGYE